MDNNEINEYPVDAAALDELSHGMVSDSTYMYYEYTAFALSLVILSVNALFLSIRLLKRFMQNWLSQIIKRGRWPK